MNAIRIGQGIDVHAFAPVGSGRKTYLGGVLVSEDIGLEGYSDADVLLHAVTDAVLGALAWGDLGQWFPDSDPAYKGIASSLLFARVWKRAHAEGWRLVNLDCNVLAQKPRLSPCALPIRNSLAQLFCATPEQISVKATTTERLGFIGREEGVMASAVVLLENVALARFVGEVPSELE